MQQISPRKYFETRLRKLPVFKCYINKNWEQAKIANLMVLRNHVNGQVSGAIFLVDLLCLGVKDATWFFNVDADEKIELYEQAVSSSMEIPYALAHNIVYAGLEFAAEYQIKPHADFGVARYALEEDDESVELIEIETGEDGIPHLMQSHPGQYADAHSKLIKYAGPGNFMVSMAFENTRLEDEDEEDWENEADLDGRIHHNLSLEDIEIGTLTLSDAVMLSNEDLLDKLQYEKREELEKQKIYTERMLRLYEQYLEKPRFIKEVLGMPVSVVWDVEQIMESTEPDLPEADDYPYGCNEATYHWGFSQYFDLMEVFPEFSLAQKTTGLSRLLLQTAPDNPVVLSNCILYLLIDPDAKPLYETIRPLIASMGKFPLIALSQTLLVTADPDIFTDPPLITSESALLKAVLPHHRSFSFDDYALFYALRCLQAAQKQHIPLICMWYRLLIDTNKADIRLPMLAPIYKAMMPVWLQFLKKILPEENGN